MAKIKNPFKKASITDTVINVGIGGAGNVAFDYIWDMLGESVSTVTETTKNVIKLVGGAVVGSMVSNKYLRAMADGFGVVGASELVSDLIASSQDEKKPKTGGDSDVTGLPYGTIGYTPLRGRYRAGSAKYARASRSGRMSGLTDFMSE